MTDHTCLACGKIHPDAQTVTLHDGRTVSAYGEEWRHEAEARSILAMPTQHDRRRILKDIEKHRGKQAADTVRDLVMMLWDKQRGII